ncbi:MAG TPA: porin family protein [Chryseosolibacter sp.]
MRQSGLFLFCLLTALAADAQISLGVKAGLNLSDVVVNNSYNPDVEPGYQIKAGFHAGMFAAIQGANSLGFAAELLYSSKGVRALNVINLHYVAVPLLLRYHINEKFFGEIGPEIGYLVNANSRHGNLNSTWDNKVDIGLDVGLQYKLGKLSCGLRFNAGFSSVIRNSGTSPQGEPIRYQNRVGQFFIAIPVTEVMH